MASSSPYKDEFATQARKLCAMGATNADLAEFFEVTPRTITHWRHHHPAFDEAVKVGKDAADERVKQALYHRAVGYTYEAVHFTSYQGEVTETPYKEHVPPDTTACIFWLKNRRPEEWRDVHLMHGQIQVTPGYDLSQLTEQELEAFRLLAEKARPRAPSVEAKPVAPAIEGEVVSRSS